MAAAKQQRQALTPASGVAVPQRGKLSNHHKTAVVVATKVNRIAAGFKTLPLLGVGKVMPFCVPDGKAKPQFLLVFLEQLNIQKLRRHHDTFFTIAVKHIKRFQVAAIASPCLSDVSGGGSMGDKVIHFAAYVDAGFTTAVKDEKVIFRRDFFVL